MCTTKTTTTRTVTTRRAVILALLINNTQLCRGTNLEFGRDSLQQDSFLPSGSVRRGSKAVSPFQSLETTLLVQEDEFLAMEESFRYLSTMSMSFSYNTGSPAPSSFSTPVSSPTSATTPSGSTTSATTTATATTTTTTTTATTTTGVQQRGATDNTPPFLTTNAASIDNGWFCLEPSNVVPNKTRTLVFSYQAQVVNDQDESFVTHFDRAMAYAMAKDGCTLGSGSRRALTASVEPSITIVSIDALPEDEILQESCRVTNPDASACRVVLAGITIVYKDDGVAANHHGVNDPLQTRFEQIWNEHVQEWVASSLNVVQLEYVGTTLEHDAAASTNAKNSNDRTWKILLGFGIVSAAVAIALCAVLSWSFSTNGQEKTFVETDSSDNEAPDAGEEKEHVVLVEVPLNDKETVAHNV